jgi:hypothetical protein
MTRQERLDIGEKMFVGAFVTSVVIETLVTLFALTLIAKHHMSSPLVTTTLLGIVFVGCLLFLANWLYSGDLTAWKAAVGWGAFQLVLSVAVIIVFVVATARSGPGDTGSSGPTFPDYLGLPNLWLAVIKAVVYAAFVGALAWAPPVRDFLGLRRGEQIAEETAAVEVPMSGVAVPLTDEQAGAFASLSNWVAAAGWVLLVAGVLRLIAGFQEMGPKSVMPGIPGVLEGAVAVILGLLFFAPASALKLFQSRDMNHLLNVFKGFQSLYFKQLILLVVAVAAAALGIVAVFVKW